MGGRCGVRMVVCCDGGGDGVDTYIHTYTRTYIYTSVETPTVSTLTYCSSFTLPSITLQYPHSEARSFYSFIPSLRLAPYTLTTHTLSLYLPLYNSQYTKCMPTLSSSPPLPPPRWQHPSTCRSVSSMPSAACSEASQAQAVPTVPRLPAHRAGQVLLTPS